MRPDVPNNRGRPRSHEAEEAILRATLDLLGKHPLRRITIEDIAEQAQVGKATIYKWWPNKSFLALTAFLTRMQKGVATKNTGSAKRDFLHQLRSLIAFYGSPMGVVFRQLLAECQADATFAESYRKLFLEPRRAAVREIWQRGVTRGEIDPSWDCELVLDMIYAPLVYRVLVGHEPFTDHEAVRLINAVFQGISKSKKATVAI